MARHVLNVGRPPVADYFVQTAVDRLRANVGFAGSDKKVIMISSSVPDEGKSYVTSSLWMNLANSGKKVCLVDLDMRKTNLRNTLRLTTGSEIKGASHYLAGIASKEEVLYETNVENAYLIPTVSLVNPSLLFEGDALKKLLLELREEFDYVIVDTPPLTLVSDGLQVARLADCCILVVRGHSTSKNQIRESLQQIESVGCPLLGIVLNRMNERNSTNRYYKGSYYEKYYTSSGGSQPSSPAPKTSSIPKGLERIRK